MHDSPDDSRASRITRAVECIQAHFAEPMRIDDLARHANMSVSSLHHHFKEATAMSPLQYQKRLRLYEARSLLLRRSRDLGVVAASVGYDKLSQFHREYKRQFALTPLQDAGRLRAAR